MLWIRYLEVGPKMGFLPTNTPMNARKPALCAHPILSDCCVSGKTNVSDGIINPHFKHIGEYYV